MTEYEEQAGYDDEPDLYDEIDEVRQQLEQQQQLAEINNAIGALERQHGERFDYETVQELGALIDAGHDPAAAYEHVAPPTAEQQDAERTFAANVQQLEREEGRALSADEQDRVWQSVVDGTDEVELHNVDTREGRTAYAASLLDATFEKQEPPETVEPLHPDADADDRKAFIAARLEGAEVDDRFSSYGIETGDTAA